MSVLIRKDPSVREQNIHPIGSLIKIAEVCEYKTAVATTTTMNALVRPRL
jgi:hypothetical protein